MRWTPTLAPDLATDTRPEHGTELIFITGMWGCVVFRSGSTEAGYSVGSHRSEGRVGSRGRVW
jgi:hypothetical protein